MNYVNEVLTGGESVRATAHFHWLYTANAVFWLIVGMLLPPLGPIVFLVLMIRKWTTEIAVTDRRVIYKRGWIARRTDEIALSRLEEINLSQGIWGRIFGFGKLRLGGTGMGNIVLPTIADPISFRKAIDAVRA